MSCAVCLLPRFGFGRCLGSVCGFECAGGQRRILQGKVIRIIVGFSAGGGFDTYARSLSRYMGKYIAGNPTIIVENMPGAGSLIAANHIYHAAKPDGLTIGAFNGNQILAQLIGGQGINFDARKMEWMGAPGYNHDLCVLNQKTGIANAEQWLASKTPIKLGGSAPGSTTDDGAEGSQGGDRFAYASRQRLQGHRRHPGCGGVG